MLCEFFQKLNQETPSFQDHATERNYLPPEMVAKIKQHLSENWYENADLIAVRQCPHKWGTFTDPNQWLWILHRFTNRYA
jgi:hypothetical protein